MNGILVLWKEKGMTSHDCVFKLRKILHTKKIGHTGTLDPEVDGVLPICVGKATKMVELMMNGDKTYQGEITIGFSTTTEDAYGEVVESSMIQKVPELQQIDEVMESMIGTITQIPPMYSAVKVNGKKLYEYARANQTVERPKRLVTIYDFKRTSDVRMNDNGTASWTFEVSCSKGTYVRTLAVDLGSKLGYPAHMSQLTRIKSAGFTPKDCITLSHLSAMEEIDKKKCLRPIEEAFKTFHQIALDDELFAKVKNGAVIPQISEQSPVFLTYKDKLVALYEQHPTKEGMMKPKKMLLGNE